MLFYQKKLVSLSLSEDRKFTLILAYCIDGRNSNIEFPKLGRLFNYEALNANAIIHDYEKYFKPKQTRTKAALNCSKVNINPELLGNFAYCTHCPKI